MVVPALPAGSTPTGNELQQYTDLLNVLSSAWPSWTPTWTNLTIGNGVVSAKYRQVGKTVDYRVKVTFGSTTALTGTPTFTLPVTPHADYIFDDQFGPGDALNFGVSSSSVKVRYNGSGIVRVDVQPTVPFTFGASDNFSVGAFTYEAA